MTKSRNLHNPMSLSAALLFSTLLLGLTIAVPVGASGEGQAGTQHEHHHATSEEPASADEGSTMADCHAMMAEQEHMTQQRETMDEALDELLVAVRSASGDAKVDAIAAVVQELVSQRRAMASMMMEHHASMMGHMMGHMGTSGMEMCPMMRGMMPEGGEDPAEDPHAGHHPE